MPYCAACLLTRHRSHPFHHIEVCHSSRIYTIIDTHYRGGLGASGTRAYYQISDSVTRLATTVNVALTVFLSRLLSLSCIQTGSTQSYSHSAHAIGQVSVQYRPGHSFFVHGCSLLLSLIQKLLSLLMYWTYTRSPQRRAKLPRLTSIEPYATLRHWGAL